MTSSRITVREDAKGRPACRKCKAPAGEPCRTPSGRIAEMVHKDRGEATKRLSAAERRHKFYASQSLRPVAEPALFSHDDRGAAVNTTGKRRARQERKAALRRKRGFRG